MCPPDDESDSQRKSGPNAPIAEPESAKRGSENVYDALLDEIMEGSLGLGQKLPTEASLAQRFAVSRPLVREALSRLRDDGLIYSQRGAGSFVKARPDRATLRFAPLDSLSGIHRIYEFRQSIESDAAYWAAKRSDQKAIAEIESALKATKEEFNNNQVGVAADFNLHLAIARASKNPFYVSALTSLRNQMLFGMTLGRQLALERQGEHNKVAARHHTNIFEAIVSGEAEQAKARMHRHLELSRKTLFEGDSEL